MRADRLLHILLLLQNQGRLTTRQLAAQLEVSERTIARDMEALSMAGIPVYAERGAHGGWRLSEQYRTRLTGMKPDELVSLFISGQEKALEDLGIRRHFDSAIQKLLSSAPATVRRSAEDVRAKLHIDGAGWHQADEQCPCLPVIQEAVWQERLLSITYIRAGEPEERTVSPLGLVAKRGVWYLVAVTEHGMRTFRISRLAAAEMKEESFERPAGFQLAQYWEQSMAEFKVTLPRYPAKLRFQEGLLDGLSRTRYVKLLHMVQTGQEIEAEVEFNTMESACGIILGFGPGMEVLGPQELRSRVCEQAAAIAALYQNNRSTEVK
jgi:predicted DNA-binding transcriptional regulator YafY